MFPGMAYKVFCILFVTTPVAPVITGIIILLLLLLYSYGLKSY